MNVQKYLDDNNIKQIYISNGIADNRNTILKNIKFNEYSDDTKSVLFWGMYNYFDIEKLLKHKSKKFIFWGGTDSNKGKHFILKKLKNIEQHICLEEFVYNNLKLIFSNILNLKTYNNNQNNEQSNEAYLKENNNNIKYNNLFNFINKCEDLIILSKGGEYDFSNDDIKNNTIYIGIKQSIINLPKKDILVLNDYEGLFGLEEIISEIKFIICPELIHYKQKESEEGNIKFNNYLKLNKFNGEIIKFCKGEYKTNKNLFLYEFPLYDSGEVIFGFLSMLNIKNKNINLYGLYTDINDNLKIMNKIKNANVNNLFIDDYKSYLHRIIYNKKDETIKNMRGTPDDVKNTLIKKKKYIYNRYKSIFKINYIYWNNDIFISIELENGTNYKKLLDYFNNITSICIVGKGELKKKISYNYDIYIGTKNTLCLLPKRDILQLNDFEGIFGNEKYLKELKFILFPITIHVECLPNIDINYENFINYCRSYGFVGNFVIFKINKVHDIKFINKYKHLDINYTKNFIELIPSSSSDIICNLLINLKYKNNLNIDLYGIGTSGNCNELVELNFKLSECPEEYIYLKEKYTSKKYDNDEITNHYTNRLNKFKNGFPIVKNFNYTFN